MELDENDIRQIVHDELHVMRLELDNIRSELASLEEIKETLSDIESALGWLVKRAQNADKKASEVTE